MSSGDCTKTRAEAQLREISALLPRNHRDHHAWAFGRVPSPSKLKSVEHDGKYSIQILDELALRRVSEAVSSVPRYFFDAEPAQSTFIEIIVAMVGGLATMPMSAG